MIKLVIAGDFVPTKRVKNLIEANQFSDMFFTVKSILDTVDYSIVNLEAPIVINNSNKINKTGPNLKSPLCTLNAIKYAGFKCVTLANNHFFDYGNIGVVDTINSCNKFGIDYIGGGVNFDDANRILYKNINGKTISIINACENEWSIASSKHGGALPLNPVNIYYNIFNARQKSDYVIVITHGGTEHYNLPTNRMQELYRFFIDVGADIVINHHQHCYSGYENYKGKYIFYGLGNFCFDDGPQAPDFWKEGYIVKLFLDDNINFQILPYKQCDKSPIIDFNIDKNKFFNKINYLNSIISDRSKLCSSFSLMSNSKEQDFMLYLEPFNNKIFKLLRRHKIIPSFINKNKMRLLYNIFRCESHRDIIFNIFNQKI